MLNGVEVADCLATVSGGGVFIDSRSGVYQSLMESDCVCVCVGGGIGCFCIPVCLVSILCASVSLRQCRV